VLEIIGIEEADEICAGDDPPRGMAIAPRDGIPGIVG
jgi:hypothetical protein